VEQFWKEWRSTSGRHNAVYDSLRPAKERFGHRWQQAVLEQDSPVLEQLVDFRGALTQYPKAYAFFSQLLDYGDPFYEKLSQFSGLLSWMLKDFTTEETDPAAVDISDVVLTHYKLEKLREEDLSLASEETRGLQGLTEAGMSRVAEKERAAMLEVIEKVNKYLGDLEASDEYKLGPVSLITNQIESDTTVQQQCTTNSAIDFVKSPALVEISEDPLWSHETQTDETIKRLRELPDKDRIQLLVDTGLLDALEQAN